MDNEINTWLQKYEPIKEIAEIEEIHTDRLTETTKNLAMQRTGYENLPLKYITDKGWYRQYQYMLLLKSESEVDKQRLENYDWLDKLTDWLDEQNTKKNFPVLEGGKKVKQVSCANTMNYQESEDGQVSVYSLQLYFNIRKEG